MLTSTSYLRVLTPIPLNAVQAISSIFKLNDDILLPAFNTIRELWQCVDRRNAQEEKLEKCYRLHLS
jgi:hypothetical protein